ncbi:CRAL/TRIO domain-containing protein [Dothidotthia symphoricarpi CBS 119687]|uniref:CRAL/TRIO domain-containing protein n=1 Tax=Dothidotthia symphoricarpi CBS 119687 TaxID=1392245 RepID=A0A6A6AGH4_9PLEO|nr:CRAL/TRIO domain-containing protein [Dothidotthia symphoricarpi CBS 119687]KAF2129997.1 CRAL/TRIO domain-containing protein [Dothidotthia symphoricarpi CBS 119687]
MAELQRVESMQYPAGHLAHLTDNQQRQLDDFKKICQDAGYYHPGRGMIDGGHDDETLLRFLRARRFIPQEAFKQFKETEDWRRDHNILELYGAIEAAEYEQTRRLYPQWIGRRDKRGIPVYLFEVAPLNSKNISAYEKDLAKSKTTSPKDSTKNLRLFALYESLTRFITPLCSMVPRHNPETPISQSNNIVDISGVGLKQFWNLKAHMQDASVLATAHYPETLDRIFIVGAPGFFPTVWGWVKRWFDPITVSKIFILSPNNVYETLSQYMDHENIPTKYGGGLDFKWTQMPSLEPEIEAQIKWENPIVVKGRNTIPIGPMKWEAGRNGEMQAWAVGCENGKPRRTLVFTIPKPVGYHREGPPMANTPAHQIGDPFTSVGTYTHPQIDDSAADHDTPPLDSPRTSGSFATTTTLPIRSGTSDTRYEQQDYTHASGQLADGTPHAATIDQHGDKIKVMEPNTIGQAPKEMPLPEPEQPPQPGYVDQAKQAAAQAQAAVTSAAGAVYGAVLGPGDKQEQPVEAPARAKSPEEQRLDSQIDAASAQDVEAFLRARNASAR